MCYAYRSVGAAIFGLAGDLYGRKWPMIVNLIIIAVLQFGTAYCYTFAQFLGVRALFGIGMGGMCRFLEEELRLIMCRRNLGIGCIDGA